MRWVPIRVRLIRESGEQLASVTDRDGLIDRAASESGSTLLKYVDAYGDTYFNRQQMPDLLTDWEAARALTRTAADEACWEDVRSLAESCAAGTHLYLKFVGD
jgi:hypothetical protein